MDKKLIRKLLASLLACAMLLASVAAFADDADPAADPTTAPAEQVEETTETTKTKTDDVTTDGAETTDPADTDPETTDPETTDPETTDPADDVDEETDTEAEKPVPPPINFGGVPNVEGAEDSEDDANAENGIAPMYFHKHEHVYDYAWDSMPSVCYVPTGDGHHYPLYTYTGFGTCKSEECADVIDVTYEVKGETVACTPDETGVCTVCGSEEYEDVTDPTKMCPDAANGGTPHASATWDPKPVETHDFYQGLEWDFNTKTDDFDRKSDDTDNNRNGHHRTTISVYKGHCDACGQDVTKTEIEGVYEPHKFVNGKCACGYRKPASTTKKTTDNRVRMGVKLAKELGKLAKSGATVNLYNEKLAYTEAEFASVTAINNPLERALMLLAALGYGDEVDYAIKNQGLTVSAEARAIIDQIRARGVIPGAAVAFQTTAKVKGKTYDAVTISVVVGGSNGVSTESFTFYKDGSKLYFAA